MPGHYDFKEAIRKGSTWNKSVRWKQSNGTPYNLAGYTGRMQIRSPDLTTLIIELNTSDLAPRMVIDQSPTDGGWIHLTITADTLNELVSVASGSYRYDLDLTDPSGLITKTILDGSVPIEAQVTV